MQKESIGRLISLINRHHQKYLTKALEPYQIGSGQYAFLKVILRNPGINQDQLTYELKFDKATTARSVKKLEEVGYIERIVDEKDRRAFKLYPTRKAKAFEPTLQDVLGQSNEKLIQYLQPEEEEQLVRLLQKINIDHGK
ncbi:MarR family transcriptional regulator [Paenibacillus selenitireducens]|uniref:MarR family transcriptional regulator n=1 Tax=Paenibacillus selenitireducens TaxID=1324314 RepID=A0A1T2XLD8_9BACL|nr:MarR family transcriptional regulator [Paenibacillus selenitireducens]OPA80546.1 MarR family transcriptional regulator [Paenibacillus selenitireducens]